MSFALMDCCLCPDVPNSFCGWPAGSRKAFIANAHVAHVTRCASEHSLFSQRLYRLQKSLDYGRALHLHFLARFGAWGSESFPLLMTIKNYALLLCGVSLFVLSAGVLCADDARPEAKQLLVSAHEASDLSAILPYELQGTVVINPGNGEPEKGQHHDLSRP